VHFPPIGERRLLSGLALSGRVRAVSFGRGHFIYPGSAPSAAPGKSAAAGFGDQVLAGWERTDDGENSRAGFGVW
jgi:hypothetical protein